ncbi:Bcr/CflA subfamily drug resistance transporter [Nitratireductor indicus C115]|uniref:Bcr/CflA family efflux transporter n=1 Tax=Nitratireductor indicus C115 TaxID=1231190 RepID=K2PRY1_9HYPH|nr:Bcr/CflA subfamily drug resistance transporter [Nitratireductor indicus C115]SFQ15985.1 MFS transporter, DHA1 family, bicyclomycin/chloramphenicol resistance protein [Nitratireductor indicus]
MALLPQAPAKPPHILTLVIATATGSLSMNIFLPSLPGMAAYFQTDYALVQLAVSLYLAATALLQLFIGPASDRFGRRPVMLVCFVIFILSTFAAIFTTDIILFLICRVLQAFSAAGMVLSRAIIRDTVDADSAASRIGYVTMGMTLVPMIGPFIGGFLDEFYGWQATFYLALAFGIFSIVVVYLNLGETNHQPTSSMLAQLKSYPELFRARRFWGYTATAAFASGAFFAFLGGGPYVATQILHLTPSQYGTYFILISIGYMIGNFSSGRFSRQIGLNRMMLAGNVIASSGLLLSLFLFSMGCMHPLSLFGPSLLLGMGNGMTLPNANAGIVSVRPHLAGSASGLGGALQIGGGAALSVLAGLMLTPVSGPYPLIWIMLTASALGIVASLYVMHVARQRGEI